MKSDEDIIKGYRLWNFRQLVKSVGGNKQAANRLDKFPSYITQIAGPNPERDIGDKIAAEIEAAFNLPPGSLDNPPPKEAKDKDEFVSKIASVLAFNSKEDREMVLEIAKVFAKNARATTKPTDL